MWWPGLPGLSLPLVRGRGGWGPVGPLTQQASEAQEQPRPSPRPSPRPCGPRAVCRGLTLCPCFLACQMVVTPLAVVRAAAALRAGGHAGQ